MPHYCKDILQLLQTEYSDVTYYTEVDGEYVIVDCFVIEGICIKCDRISVDTLDKYDMQILFKTIKDMFNQVRELCIYGGGR